MFSPSTCIALHISRWCFVVITQHLLVPLTANYKKLNSNDAQIKWGKNKTKTMQDIPSNNILFSPNMNYRRKTHSKNLVLELVLLKTGANGFAQCIYSHFKRVQLSIAILLHWNRKSKNSLFWMAWKWKERMKKFHSLDSWRKN